jgi:hypothetical protein
MASGQAAAIDKSNGMVGNQMAWRRPCGPAARNGSVPKARRRTKFAAQVAWTMPLPPEVKIPITEGW